MKNDWKHTRLAAGALTAALLLSSGALAAELASRDEGTAEAEPAAVTETAAAAGTAAAAEEAEVPAAPEEGDHSEGPASAAEGAVVSEAAGGQEAGEEAADPESAVGTAAQPAQPYIQPAAQTAEDWRLLLVNPWNDLPEDYAMELAVLSNGLKVDTRIYEDLEAMLSACRAAGLRPVVCSAYRTEATQVRLYNNKIARLRAAGWTGDALLTEAARWVAVPGTSEHQTGLALDIVSAGYQLLDDAQADTAEQQWLMEHCWEYGFILRYPEDKTEITGIGYEPWHYRYVGREAAAAIHGSGLCLEEYLAALTAAEPEAAEDAVTAEEPAAAEDAAPETAQTDAGLPAGEQADAAAPANAAEVAAAPAPQT